LSREKAQRHRQRPLFLAFSWPRRTASRVGWQDLAPDAVMAPRLLPCAREEIQAWHANRFVEPHVRVGCSGAFPAGGPSIRFPGYPAEEAEQGEGEGEAVPCPCRGVAGGKVGRPVEGPGTDDNGDG